jgi:hypothetical protein
VRSVSWKGCDLRHFGTHQHSFLDESSLKTDESRRVCMAPHTPNPSTKTLEVPVCVCVCVLAR